MNNAPTDQEFIGTVKWFDEKKGFGFLTSDSVRDEQGNRKDVFVHYRYILQEGYKSLVRGELVAFSPVTTHKGPMATKVKKVPQ